MSPLPVLSAGTLWHYYRARLRTQAAQELLALVGIATGVALIFAVEVANTSVTGSVQKLVRGVTGEARLQVAARGGEGFHERVAAQVEHVPGVSLAAPALERRVGLSGTSGARAIDLIGVTPKLGSLGGQLVEGLGAHGLRLSNALVLPEPLAEAIGVRPGDSAQLQIGGRTTSVPVSATVPTAQYGDLAGSPVAMAPLDYVQQLAGVPDRISRVLVATAPARTNAVRAELRERFGERLNVGSANAESRLISQAAAPNDQSTGLFAGVSALIGGLFAFTAMMLTVPERRRFIAELRLQGFGTGQVATQVAFESLVLGVAASALGLLLGDQLSRHLFEPMPGSLSFAFAIGDQRVVTGGTVALAFGAGVVATLIAGARPLGDVFSRRPLDAVRAHGESAEGVRRGAQQLMLLAGLLLTAGTTLAVLVAPDLTVFAPATLALALVLVLPTTFNLVLKLLSPISNRSRLGLLSIAASDLRASPTRSVALAATAALALFGTVAIEGAHRDLLRGLNDGAYELTRTADLWVTAAAPENTLATMPFTGGRLAQRLRADPGVASVRSYHSSFLDYRGRRLWVIGKPPGDRPQVPAGQLVGGDAKVASRRLLAGGWVAMADDVADARGLHNGQRFTLPTPTGPQSFRLAARLTNFGWAPGTLIMGTRDYRRAWGVSTPTALEVDLAPGIGPSAGKEIVGQAIGAEALQVQTAGERWGTLRAGARDGLSRLSQIATLALVCAIFAVAAAMGAGVWQRRGALAELRVHGFSWMQVWGSLLAEVAVLIGCGGLTGVVFGLYGQALAARWLSLGTGFPTIYAPAAVPALALLTLVAMAALAVAALPGFLAARAPLELSFREE
jgi:putative ABC transport system permease protein